MEWACIGLVNPHLDWPAEQTVGTHIDVSHQAATPPGLHVSVTALLLEVERRRLTFTVQAHDGVDLISSGTHQRTVIDAARFTTAVRAKVPAPTDRAIPGARADAGHRAAR